MSSGTGNVHGGTLDQKYNAEGSIIFRLPDLIIVPQSIKESQKLGPALVLEQQHINKSGGERHLGNGEALPFL